MKCLEHLIAVSDFVLLLKKKNIEKIKKVFSKKFKPYEIGYVSKSHKKVNLSNAIKW